jgi:hypothetical protein
MRPVIGTLLAVTIALVLASPASAQAPPPWKQGQPADLANSTLAPIAQPPAPAAASEIPVDKIKVPRGFKVSLWASGINNARAMVWGDNVLSARGWSSAGTQHSSDGSGSRDSVRQQRTQSTQRSSASEKDPAAHSEHRVRARAGLALTALNTA